MSTIPLRRRTRVRVFTARLVGAAVAGAVGLGALAAAPAFAGDAVFTVGGDSGATAHVDDFVFTGTTIHVEGSAWTRTGGVGSCVMVKLGDGSGASGTALGVTQVGGDDPTGSCAGVTPPDGVFALVPADETGAFAADLPFPTPDNTDPAVSSSDWAAGTAHHLRLLTGADGSPARSAYLDFTVAAPASTPTLTAASGSYSATGASAALTGSGFAGGTVLSAALDGTPLSFSGRGITAGPSYTVGAAGTVTGVNVVLPADTRAGSYTVIVHGDDGSDEGFDLEVPVTVTPAATWSGGTTLGASGDLTLEGLTGDSTVSEVTVGDDVVASGLSVDATGTAAGSYTIPADATLGTQTATVAQTDPAATYTFSVKVSPSATTANEDLFTATASAPTEDAAKQGLYQSAYSAASDALYVTAAYQTTATEDDPTSGWDGYVYKLDPDTLEVLDSVRAPYVDGEAGARLAPYGIGVDDTNGTVWVTNTRQNTVTVYDQETLEPLAHSQGTVSHGRDVVYDPASNQVFVSSASEGTSGDGYIAVFEGGDNDADGTPYEHVTDIATGPRTTFNPVSLALDTTHHTLYSPSLSSDRVAVIDTVAKTVELLTLPGLDVGGRGASGIAIDPQTNHLFIASQNNDELLVANARTGATIKEVPTGTQALNVAWDPVRRLAYVANFGGTTVTVTDAGGNKVANLGVARPNHVAIDGLGDVYAVDKSSPVNNVTKLTPSGVAAIAGTPLSEATDDPRTTPLSVTATYGGDIRVAGTNWTVADGSSGSTVAVKYDGEGAAERFDASATGDLSITLPVPAGWTPGSSHHLRLLTGSLKEGDRVRTVAVAVTVRAAGLKATTPTVSGTPQVGRRLTARTGSWTPTPAYTYQWLRNGKAIKGATDEKYAVVAADAGTRLSVRVTAKKTGYTTVTRTSMPTSTVRKAALKTSRPWIKGLTKVGRTVTAVPGSWTSGARLHYQWRANGRTVKGATAKALRVTRALVGKRITVKVTGTKPGYVTATRISKPRTARR
ncbi:YncE family protein [Nocardioides sp. KR10-350]|uniref:YncE family protein n=1 Tax=Nocardioides cheoyonin TaxID=3156615 RepID=UPI0032B51B22